MKNQHLHATFTQQRVFHTLRKVLTLAAIAFLLSAAVMISGSRAAAHSAQQEEPALGLNGSVERTLNGSEKHRYKVEMEAGQYARISVMPQKGELKVELFAPGDLKAALQVSGENGTPEGAVVSIIADRAGIYRLTVSLKDEKLDGIIYSAVVKEKREATQIDRDRTQAESLFAEAEVLRNLGKKENLEESITKYEASLSFWRKAEDKRGEADAYSTQGYVYYQIANYEKVLESYEMALRLSREVQATRIEADTLNNIGLFFRTKSDYQKAIEYYLQALPLMRSIRNRKGEAGILNNVASLYRALGQTSESLTYLNDILLMRREEKDRAGEARTFILIAANYAERKEYNQALENYENALAILRDLKTKDNRSLANALTNIGSVYQNLERPDTALLYYLEAISLQKEAGDVRGETVTKNFIGKAYEMKGEFERAKEHYDLALAASREMGNSTLETLVLFNLAQFERKRSNTQQALTHIKNALAIFEASRSNVSSPDLRASYLASRRIYYELYIDLLIAAGQQHRESGYFATALQVSERAHARALLDILAEIRSDLKQGVDVALIEQERELQKRRDDKAAELMGLLLNKKNVDVDKKQNDEAEKAFATLNSQLEQVKAQIKKTSPKYAALAQPQPLSLNDIQQKVLDADTMLLEYVLGEQRSYLFVVTADKLQTFILPKRAEIEGVAARVVRWFGRSKFEDAAEFSARVESLERFNTECLPDAAQLGQILLGPIADQLKQKKLLVVSDGILHYIPYAALPEPTLTGTPQGVLEARLSNQNSTGEKREPGLKVTTRAPQADYTPLVLKHEITSIPSASTLYVIREETADRPLAPKTVAVFADPVFEPSDERITAADPVAASSVLASRSTGLLESQAQRAARQVNSSDSGELFARLRYTRQEAQNIGHLIPASQGRIALDFDASRAAVKNHDLAQYRMVHFATHGYLIEQYPSLSGIVLSLVDRKGHKEDGYLKLADVFNLKLPVDLVVLSACQTGLGKIVEGEGVIGMTRGLMYAGAKRVIVSLWSVSDLSTSSLMSELYTRVLSGKTVSPAGALRAAQINMWQQKRWKSPYYWAGFVIQGEPR